MELKYPLARLSVLYQIHGKNRTCEEAMILAAYEGGLVRHGSLDGANAIGHGSCGAMITARRIAEQKMIELHGSDSSNVEDLANTIIYNVETGIKRYFSAKEDLIKPKNHELECLKETDQPNCNKLAPIVIDLLIQQLRLH